MRIFPQSFVQGLFLSLKDLYTVVMTVSSLLSFLAIKSYSIFDNSVNASTPQLTKNWLGWGGAFFADICCQFFGVFSYAIPFVLALAALRAVMSYFKRPLSNSFALLIFGILQLLITFTYYQGFLMKSGKPLGGAFGLIMLKSLEKFLDMYQLREWLEELVFVIGLSGFFCTIFGLGITEEHVKSMRDCMKCIGKGIKGIFDAPNEYIFQRSISLKENNEPELDPELDISFFNTSGDEFPQDTGRNIETTAQKQSGITIEKPRELEKKFHKIASNREDGYVYPPVELLDDTQQKKLIT